MAKSGLPHFHRPVMLYVYYTKEAALFQVYPTTTKKPVNSLSCYFLPNHLENNAKISILVYSMNVVLYLICTIVILLSVWAGSGLHFYIVYIASLYKMLCTYEGGF